jgi:hypothetical protein
MAIQRGNAASVIGYPPISGGLEDLFNFRLQEVHMMITKIMWYL